MENSEVEVRTRSEPVTAGVEVAVVFAAGIVGVGFAGWFAGDRPFLHQALVWGTNVVMLLLIGVALRIRGEGWDRIGLNFRLPSPGEVIRGVAWSVPVLVAAAAAYALSGAALATFLEGAPRADMSGYDYLEGNLPLFLLSLSGIYLVSSFGEEVVYRGFLITRLTELFGGERSGVVAAFLGSAVIFGLAHFAWGWVGIVQTTAMGLVLGAFYLLLGRRLWILVLAHVWADTLLLYPLYSGAAAP